MWISLPYDDKPNKLHPSILKIMKDKNFNPVVDKDPAMMSDFKPLEKYKIKHFDSGTIFNKDELCIVFDFIEDGDD